MNKTKIKLGKPKGVLTKYCTKKNREKIKEIYAYFSKRKNANPSNSQKSSSLTTLASPAVSPKKSMNSSQLNFSHSIKNQNDLTNVVIKSCKNYDELISRDRELNSKKKSIKARLKQLLSHTVVLSDDLYEKCSELFHFESEAKKRELKAKKLLQYYQAKKHFKVNSSFLRTRSTPELFDNVKASFRYEDLYFSPEEVILKNFTDEEIRIMQHYPKYFGLDEKPFLNCKIKFDATLTYFLNNEGKSQKYLWEKNQKKIFQMKLRRNNKYKKMFENFPINSPLPTKKSTSAFIKRSSQVNKRKISDNQNSTLFSSFEYEKMFKEIEERKFDTLSRRQEKINYKKEKFEVLKNIQIKKKNEQNSQLYEARKVVNKIEKIYLLRDQKKKYLFVRKDSLPEY